ncbi:MAG: hypothetical protein AB7G93_22230 [Bdellovibrionales bacterium]
MDALTPPLLTAIRETRWLVSSGRSMRESFRMYLDSTNDSLAAHLRQRWILKWQTPHHSTSLTPFPSHYQSVFWEIVERGCAGQPVLESLVALEEEVELAAQAELDHHLATLPFKALIPLMTLQFPAFLLVLLGPLWREFNRAMGT